MEQHFAHRHGREQSGGEMIYIDADASTGIANFDFNHLSAGDLGYLLHRGSGHPLQSAARRENAGDRAGGRLGYFARAGLGQP